MTEKIRRVAAYFETHAGRVRYHEFRRQHLFVGSGVIEAGCKTVTGQRLKQSAMFRPFGGAKNSSLSAAVTTTETLRATGSAGASRFRGWAGPTSSRTVPSARSGWNRPR